MASDLTQRTALVCIAKDEDWYIDEWLDYHFSLGFSDAFVYQNDWRYRGDPQSHGGNVSLVEWDGACRQMDAYNDFIDRHSDGFAFAAFIDVDEFVTLRDGSLSDFLVGYGDEYAVALNWKIFGDSGLHYQGGDRSVLKRFTRCQRGFNKHVKTVLNVRRSGRRFHFNNPHCLAQSLVCDVTAAADGGYVRGPWHEVTDASRVRAWISHYRNKTPEEWLAKMERGRADIAVPYAMSSFDEHNFNDVEDTTARDFMERNGCQGRG